MKHSKRAYNRGELAYIELKKAGVRPASLARELKISLQLLRWQLFNEPTDETMACIAKAVNNYSKRIAVLSSKFSEKYGA